MCPEEGLLVQEPRWEWRSGVARSAQAHAGCCSDRHSKMQHVAGLASADLARARDGGQWHDGMKNKGFGPYHKVPFREPVQRAATGRRGLPNRWVDDIKKMRQVSGKEQETGNEKKKKRRQKRQTHAKRRATTKQRPNNTEHLRTTETAGKKNGNREERHKATRRRQRKETIGSWSSCGWALQASTRRKRRGHFPLPPPPSASHLPIFLGMRSSCKDSPVAQASLIFV